MNGKSREQRGYQVGFSLSLTQGLSAGTISDPREAEGHLGSTSLDFETSTNSNSLAASRGIQHGSFEG